MHSAQETAPPRIGLEEVLEQRPVPAEGLCPAMRTLANGILQVRPHREERLIGIEDVAGQGKWAVVAEIGFSDGPIGISAMPFFEQSHAYARIQQAVERFVAGARAQQAGGQTGAVRGTSMERIEHAQRDGREHGFGAPEGIDQFHHGRGIGGCIGSRIGGEIRNAHWDPRKWS